MNLFPRNQIEAGSSGESRFCFYFKERERVPCHFESSVEAERAWCCGVIYAESRLGGTGGKLHHNERGETKSEAMLRRAGVAQRNVSRNDEGRAISLTSPKTLFAGCSLYPILSFSSFPFFAFQAVFSFSSHRRRKDTR